MVKGCVYMGEGPPTEASQVAVPLSIGDLRVDAFCV